MVLQAVFPGELFPPLTSPALSRLNSEIVALFNFKFFVFIIMDVRLLNSFEFDQ